MAYNREDMITWNELAPSLQTKLQGYADGISNLTQKYEEEHLSMTTIETNLASMIQAQSEAQTQMQQSISQLVTTVANMKTGIDTMNQTQNQMQLTTSAIQTNLQNSMAALNSTNSAIKTAIETMASTIATSHTETKELLTAIKDKIGTGGSGSGSGSGGTGGETTDTSFKLSDVVGAVDEFGSLTEEEQIIANAYKQAGKTNEEIITWLRTYRSGGSGSSAFSLDDVEGAAEEFGSLTSDEQIAANALKKAGKTNEEIIAWLRTSRGTTKPVEDDPFDITTIEGAVAEFGSLTAEEQAQANSMKKSGRTNYEILEWIRNYRNTYVDPDVKDYESVINTGTNLGVHEADLLAHSNLKSGVMMHRIATSYVVGDRVALGELPEHLILEATTNGVTSYVRPNFKELVGSDVDASAISRDTVTKEVTQDIKNKILSGGGTNVNTEILTLHKAVFDHQYDQDAHDLTCPTRHTHKIGHNYERIGMRVFGHGLEPNMRLEVYKTGITGAIAPGVAGGKTIPTYVAPTLNNDNQLAVLADIQTSIDNHVSSSTAHYADLPDFLFEDVDGRKFKYIKIGNSCRLCQMAG